MNDHPGSLAPQELIRAIGSIIEEPIFSGARFGLDVRDLTNGVSLFQHNAAEIFAAASTTKIPSCAYALTLLGPDFRFRTRFVRTGRLDESGTLHGDLILLASGDPNLSNRVTPEDTLDFENLDHGYAGPTARVVQRDPLQVIHALARGARDAGIRRITGTVLIDVQLFEEGRYGGADETMSPVTVNDNLIDIEATAGVTPGDPITYRASPQSGYVHFINQAITGDKNSEPELQFSKEQRAADGTWSVVISGSVPTGSVAMAAFAVESPSRFARTLLVEALANLGIVVEGGLVGSAVASTSVSEEAVVVAEHVSPPLAETTKVVLKVSQNLHAEMLIPVIGAMVAGARGKEARRAGYACCADVLKQWKVGQQGYLQGDASGLYGYFSPQFMSQLLVHLAGSGIYKPLLMGLPIMGRDGTLWNIQQESAAAGHVAAKTGTLICEHQLDRRLLLISKGLAGYITTRSGRDVAFAIYLNNFMCARSAEVDPVRLAGQPLGRIASAMYEHL